MPFASGKCHIRPSIVGSSFCKHHGRTVAAGAGVAAVVGGKRHGRFGFSSFSPSLPPRAVSWLSEHWSPVMSQDVEQQEGCRREPEEKAAVVKELSVLELMGQRNKGMHSERSVAAGRAFCPRATDVFVVTYPKCGTTWVTQICHQIRTGGHMNFEEIAEVCPWDILAYDCGQDLDADHVANPRIFKSHERAGDIAKGAKYIHVCRDPEDAFISFYRFLPAWAAIPPGSITVEEFATAIFGGVSHSGGIWDFFTGWWERRADPQVLWVCYEDLRSNLREQICRIAAFMEVPLDEALLGNIEELSSFAYMQAHSGQFDEHLVFQKVRDQMGIPPEYVFGEVEVSKVRSGGGVIGEGRILPENVQDMLRRRWQVSVEAKTGLASYNDLREAVGRL